MITYRVDKSSQDSLNSHLKDMTAVLEEIPQTLAVLQKLLSEHKNSLSSPSLNRYREDLLFRASTAVEITTAIAQGSKQLSAASEQATKHLAALEDHLLSMLSETRSEQRQAVQVN